MRRFRFRRSWLNLARFTCHPLPVQGGEPCHVSSANSHETADSSLRRWSFLKNRFAAYHSAFQRHRNRCFHVEIRLFECLPEQGFRAGRERTPRRRVRQLVRRKTEYENALALSRFASGRVAAGPDRALAWRSSGDAGFESTLGLPEGDCKPLKPNGRFVEGYGFPSWTRFELLPFGRRQRSSRLSSGFKQLRLPEAPHAYSQSRRALREECGSCVNSGQRLVHSGY
jgi:hypothetical protein